MAEQGLSNLYMPREKLCAVDNKNTSVEGVTEIAGGCITVPLRLVVSLRQQ